jgi:elongation factor Ts
MMAVSPDMVRRLRDQSGAGVMNCKKALEKAEGEGLNDEALLKRAGSILEEEGAEKMARRQDRETAQGVVDCYVHGSRIGAIVELNCETDFVARNEAFRNLAHEVAMQVASMNPLYLDEASIPEGTPGSKEELALLSQPFIKDPKRTIGDLVNEVSRTTGEVVRVRRFERFELGK